MSPDDVKDAMKECRGCGRPTLGSVGASGLRWATLCQPCKDAADRSALHIVSELNRKLDRVFGKQEYKTEML